MRQGAFTSAWISRTQPLNLSIFFPGSTVNHDLLSLGHAELEYARKTAEKSWEKQYGEYGEPFNIDIKDIDPEISYTSNCVYDLMSAAQRQMEFYYHVSLPHYQNAAFLHEAVVR